MDNKAAISALSALAFETRLEAVQLLADVGDEGMSAGELARRLNVTQNTLSDHLQTLARADLVTAERQSRSIIYRINPAACTRLLAHLQSTCLKTRTS